MIEALPWSPDSHALSVVLRPDPGREGPTTISVRHPSAPYEGLIRDFKEPFHIKGLSQSDVHGLVTTYLESLTDSCKEPKEIPVLGFSLAMPGLRISKAVHKLTYLPFEDKDFPWKTSVWFERLTGGNEEHTLVILIASESSGDEILSRCGIRVVMHFCEERKSLLITSMSAYLPPGAVVQLMPCSSSSTQPIGPIKQEVVRVDLIPWREPISQKPKSNDNGVTHSISRRRPTGEEEILEQYIGGRPNFNRETVYSSVKFVLHHPSEFVRTDIDSGTLDRYLAKNSKGLTKSAPINVEPIRSDAFSASQAYYNANLLFDCFRRYSIRPENYFRSAGLPLAIHYRSGMPYGPGKSGQTVNAAVQPYEPDTADPIAGAAKQPNKWRRHQIAPCLCQDRPELHMHFALGNRSHRGREKWSGSRRSPAEPLGIVADPRWVWHEFGHVLLMATTGELEMRFAHSPGDALAAIAEDPGSAFVEATGNQDVADETTNRRWRGATFPWVYIPRRHDRCVKRGWSWSGAMHKPLRDLPDAKQPRRKGYRSEQILSTSLFRLYLCLGGATPNRQILNLGGLQRRHAASEYTLYLVIKGLGLLGDARVVAANHPDQLVSALIDADVGTKDFVIEPLHGESFPIGPFRGGFAHKVVRWAFEAQGLYAVGAIDNNDKGEPPAVDIYIEDGRPPYEEWCDGRVDHGAGSYVPVSLAEPDHESDWPRWFARNKAIQVKQDKGKISVEVTVRNRGSEPPGDVVVSVFYAEWEKGDELPEWESKNNWKINQKCGAWSKVGKIASSDISKPIGPFDWKPPSRKSYLILAEATCAADRANTDWESHLPCSRGPMSLADLVANDNNLGLALAVLEK